MEGVMALGSAKEIAGAYATLGLSFSELEAGVAATTAIPFADGGDAAAPVLGKAGYILGMIVGSEAGANFTLRATIDGTATGATLTVNAAGVSLYYPTPIPFASDEAVGVTAVADTTSRDVKVVLLVAVSLVD
jgi:hypothetical protein